MLLERERTSHPDDRPMTLCIAAVCSHEDRPAFVVCADRQGTYADFIKSNDTTKVGLFQGSDFFYMFADEPTAARELAAELSPVLSAYHMAALRKTADFDLRSNALLQSIKALVGGRKRQIADEFLTRKYGFTRTDFYGGSVTMSDLERAAIANEIAGLSLRCSMIIGCASDAEPILFTIAKDGDVFWSENYSCIGSGDFIARAMLCQVDWDDRMSVVECAIRLMTAKQAAERDPYVGESGHLVVFLPHMPRLNFSAEGVKYIRDRTTKLTRPTGIEVKDEFFLEEDWAAAQKARKTRITAQILSEGPESARDKKK